MPELSRLLLTTMLLAMASPSVESSLPNIVHIFADDLGKGSVGVHGQLARQAAGQQHIKTPGLDTLANAGMVFNRAYSATLCSPSRGMLYLGFNQAHNANDRNTVSPRAQDITTAEVLEQAGYTTAVYGKWGFGGSSGTQTDSAKQHDLRINPSVTSGSALPNTHGFDEFTGYINHTRAHRYYTSSLWTTDPTGNPVTSGLSELMLGNVGPSNTNLHVDYTHDVIAARSEQFIEDHYQDAAPFYMQVNYTIPHNDLEAIQYEPGWFDDYNDVDTSAWTAKEKYYAAMITRMDRSIGSLMAKLADPDGNGSTSDSILGNTLIFFTSDNGATDADFNTAGLNAFGINDTLRGGKRDLWEGGINMPLFARWDGVINPGGPSNLQTDLTDFMATIADIARVQAPVGIDGLSLLPTLTGDGIQRRRDYLIFEHHEGDGPDPNGLDPRWAIIRGDHKLIEFSTGEQRLYNLATDPDENNQLNQGNPANGALVAELTAIALAEGVEQPASYDHQYAEWTGTDGGKLGTPSNWNLATSPAPTWSTVVNNSSGADSVVIADAAVDTLGIEVQGDNGTQTVRVVGSSLTGRNAVRIDAGGRIYLEDATLTSWRWTDVLAGGTLAGHGTVEKDVCNQGLVAPGVPSDLTPPTPPPDVDTGVVTAVDFDIQGQDPATVTTTDTLSPYAQIAAGLQMGPGISVRGTANDGNEFNVTGFPRDATSLADAIAGSDYFTFTIDSIAGIEMLVDSITFQLRRNGTGAAQEYAILSSLDGFGAGTALATLNLAVGDATTHDFSASYTGGQWTPDPVEVRLYGWDQEGASGNTHLYDANMTASFRTADGATIDATGMLTLTGDFFHQSGGTLALDIGGTDNSDPSNPEYDALAIAGAATLEGGLTVDLIDGFSPALGNIFTILTAQSISGTFDTVDGVVMTADNVGAFRVHRSPSTVTLEVLAGGVTANGTPNWWLAQHGLATDTTDTDGDGQNEAAEYLANTDPNDPFDVLRVSNIEPDGSGTALSWPTKPDRVYRIERSYTLAPGSWVTIESDLTPTGAIITRTVPPDPNSEVFYRIGSSLP